jgi:formylglycine-generating enzyme required for sulfatase activity
MKTLSRITGPTLVLAAFLICAGCAETDRRSDAVNGTTEPERPGMILVPKGEFLMGCPEGVGEPDTQPRHRVRLDAFFLDTKEVTNNEYQVCSAAGVCPAQTFNSCYHWVEGECILVPSIPAAFKEGDHPAVCVPWADADAYCAQAGKRLPTEAEWERATNTPCSADTPDISNDWTSENSSGQTHPVGRKRPNSLGFYDMLGNVCEWVSDWYDPDYYSVSPQENPAGPENGFFHVLRGGAWSLNINHAASFARIRAQQCVGSTTRGFRCAAPAPN